MWILLLGELTLFALLFWTYLSARAAAPADFAIGRQALHAGIGLINTIVLVSGSWLAASAVAELECSHRDRAIQFFQAAAVCGLLFMAIKSSEYYLYLGGSSLLLQSGLATYYFALTGIHLLHMVVASILLVATIVTIRQDDPAKDKRILPELSSLYWHMVDVVWLVLYFIFYIC